MTTTRFSLPLVVRNASQKFKTRGTWVGITLLAFLLIACAVFWESPWVDFWLQVITGNFSPAHPGSVDRGQFTVAIILAILINWGPLIGAFAVVRGYIEPLLSNERKKRMDLAHAVKNRDSIVLASIRTAFGHAALDDVQRESMAEIARQAYFDGVEKWKKRYLKLATDQEDAAKILSILDPDP